MPNRIPDHGLLQAFLDLARTGSFTEAARVAGLTQPAISHRIRKLEEAVGHPLFFRTTTLVQLTPAGEDLRWRLEPVMAELDEIFGSASLGAKGVLQVEMESSFAQNWLTPRLDRFTSRFPEISIDLRIRTEGVTMDRGSALAIRWGDGDWGRYVARWLFGLRFTPMCTPEFQGRHNIRVPADLLTCTLLHDRITRRWADWLRIAGVAGGPRHEGHIFNDTALLEHAVDQGRGVALLSPLMLPQGARRVMPFPDITSELDEGYYILKPTARLRGAAAAFEKWLIEEAAAQS